jgi:hypothetical protein
MSVESSIDKNDSERTSFQPDILKSGLGAASYSTQMQLLLRLALHIKWSNPRRKVHQQQWYGTFMGKAQDYPADSAQ